MSSHLDPTTGTSAASPQTELESEELLDLFATIADGSDETKIFTAAITLALDVVVASGNPRLFAAASESLTAAAETLGKYTPQPLH